MSKNNLRLRLNLKISLYGVQGYFLRTVLLREVEHLITLKRATWKRDGSGRIVGCKMLDLQRETQRSPASITARECAINVGGERISRGRELEVRMKIECWPDARNPRYCAAVTR